MTWVLFDYGVGNLHSLNKALQAAGAETTITQEPQELADATVAVLPGVGAFGHVMESLGSGADVLRARHAAGKPILGICIGQQVLYEGSDESTAPGIGILPGHVQRLGSHAGKVPHMGWNTIQTQGALSQFNGEHVYYVHSFAAPSLGNPCEVATTTYGQPFAAAIQSGNTWGFQFHPEKSSHVGQSILRHTVASLEAA